VIDRATYVMEKSKGMSQKKSLEEQRSALLKGRTEVVVTYPSHAKKLAARFLDALPELPPTPEEFFQGLKRLISASEPAALDYGQLSF